MMGEALFCVSPHSDREFKLCSHVTPWSEGGGPKPCLWESQPHGGGAVCSLRGPQSDRGSQIHILIEQLTDGGACFCLPQGLREGSV